jgi:hypothetical protein
VSDSTYPSAVGAKVLVAPAGVVELVDAGAVVVDVVVVDAGIVVVVVVVAGVVVGLGSLLGDDVSRTRVGRLAATSRLAKVFPVVDVVVMTNVYVPLPVTTEETSALAVVFDVKGLIEVTRLPTLGAFAQVTPVSVQSLAAVEIWMPVALVAYEYTLRRALAGAPVSPETVNLM